MANPEHVALVHKGRDAINHWRRQNQTSRLDLSGANLVSVHLHGADLGDADLREANLSEAILNGAYMATANLRGANLSGATLILATLPRAILSGADLSEATLAMANLSLTLFKDAILDRGELSGANAGAIFVGASLRGVSLRGTNLTHANLDGADLSHAILRSTALCDVDLSSVRGLATIIHESPSSVGVDSLVASVRGAGTVLTKELANFFRDAGVPAELLGEVPRIVAEVEYYTCFISYGEPDQKLAQRLYGDLKATGVSCWQYDLDSTAGERTWREIGQRRRDAEKMVVLCSAAALVRDGVRKEIEEQLDEDPEKLVPISLDDLWKHPGFRVVRGRDLKPFLLDRNYADFTNLSYDEALGRLLNGLRRRAAVNP